MGYQDASKKQVTFAHLISWIKRLAGVAVAEVPVTPEVFSMQSAIFATPEVFQLNQVFFITPQVFLIQSGILAKPKV